MQHAQSRLRSLRWIGRCGLAALAGLIAFGVSPALPALAGTWSVPVQLPGSCGSAVAVNQAGALAAGGTFTAADGTTHVQVCTSPDGKTWQAADLGPGRHRAARRAAPGHGAEPGRARGRGLGQRGGLPGRVRIHPAGRGAAAGRQLGRAGDAQHRTLLRRRRGGTRHGRLRQRDRRLGRQLRRRQPLRRAPGRRQLGSGPGAVERQRPGGGAWSRPGGQPGRERRRGLCQQGRRDLGRLWHHRGRAFRAGPGGRRRLQHGLRPEGRAR